MMPAYNTLYGISCFHNHLFEYLRRVSVGQDGRLVQVRVGLAVEAPMSDCGYARSLSFTL